MLMQRMLWGSVAGRMLGQAPWHRGHCPAVGCQRQRVILRQHMVHGRGRPVRDAIDVRRPAALVCQSAYAAQLMATARLSWALGLVCAWLLDDLGMKARGT